MFGLLSFFKALAKLTSEVDRAAEIFATANRTLEKQLAVDQPADQPAVNGARRKQLAARGE